MVPQLTSREVATNARTCESCGRGDSWAWRGIRAPEYVRRNKGFGISRISVDADAVQLNQEKRAFYRNVLSPGRQPGGLYYGGSPPPWMDDPDEWETVSPPVLTAEELEWAAIYGEADTLLRGRSRRARVSHSEQRMGNPHQFVSPTLPRGAP